MCRVLPLLTIMTLSLTVCQDLGASALSNENNIRPCSSAINGDTVSTNASRGSDVCFMVHRSKSLFVYTT